MQTRSMKTRRLGRTELQISELSLGGGMVGGMLIREPEEVRREAIRRVIAAGINWIDTAPSYGNGESESTLGRLCHELGDGVHVSSKFRIDPAGTAIEAQIEASLHASLKRLNRSRIDVLQLHNRIMPERGRHSLGIDDVLGSGGVAEALERLVARGLIGFAGFTALGDAESCHRVIRSGRFDTAQIYYNLLNPSAGMRMTSDWSAYDFDDLIATCRATDTGVLCIRVLAAGIIATDTRHGRESPLLPGTDVASDEARARAVFEHLGSVGLSSGDLGSGGLSSGGLGTGLGTHLGTGTDMGGALHTDPGSSLVTPFGTRAQTGIRFALAHPDISSVVVGIANLDQLDEMLAAGRLGGLPPTALRTLDGLYRSDFRPSARAASAEPQQAN